MTVRAVVFDLWGTLARWPEGESGAFRHRWASHVGVRVEDIDALWYGLGAYERRETGSIASAIRSVCDALGVRADVDELVSWRLDFARRGLVPSPGALSTLDELQVRGIRVGVVTNCTEDVALVWNESPFARSVDAAVFSATAGWMKPDRRIYERACTELGVEPSDCLFVGDGANDELGGAQRAGMTSVLIHEAGQDPVWEGLREWSGLRIKSIPQVLDLLG